LVGASNAFEKILFVTQQIPRINNDEKINEIGEKERR
jgi:hypothetical protein